MAAKQIGWLHSTPEHKHDNGKTDRWPHDRLTQYEIQGDPPPMVEITHGRYFIEAMVELRPMRVDSFGGINPPDWTELKAYGKLSGMVSEIWEYRLLMRMCKAYIAGYIEGKEILSIPPIERDEEDG